MNRPLSASDILLNTPTDMQLGDVIHHQKFGMVFPVDDDPLAKTALSRCAQTAGLGEHQFDRCETTNDLRLRLYDLMESASFRDSFHRLFNAVVPKIEAALERRESLDDVSQYDPSGTFAAALRLTPSH